MLTHVVCDDGEGLKVGSPHVLGHVLGVLLETPQKKGSPALWALDQIPVHAVGWIQDGTARPNNILQHSYKPYYINATA